MRKYITKKENNLNNWKVTVQKKTTTAEFKDGIDDLVTGTSLEFMLILIPSP